MDGSKTGAATIRRHSSTRAVFATIHTRVNRNPLFRIFSYLTETYGFHATRSSGTAILSRRRHLELIHLEGFGHRFKETR